MASLRELQLAFAAALHEPEVACAVAPVANLAVYRNNSAHAFRSALESSYPVVRKRVGDEYFRQIAAQYRARFPSRSGDLHGVGRHFATFLLEQHRGSEYSWLADLARLEWAREEAAIAITKPAVTAEVLAAFAPEELERVVFTLQPSLALVASDFPVFTIWMSNQSEDATPVDQLLGCEQGMILSRNDHVEVRVLSPRLFSYLTALGSGAPLGEAVSTAGFDQAGLIGALGFVFSESLVCSVKVD